MRKGVNSIDALAEVCVLSCERWVNSLPDNVQPHIFSAAHIEIMKPLLQLEKGKRKISKITLRVMLIAAILLSIAISAFATPSTREFIVKKFTDHSSYTVLENGEKVKAKKVKEITLNYIPEGFVLVDEDIGELGGVIYREYAKNADEFFSINKYQITDSIDFDNERYDNEIILINNIEVIHYYNADGWNGLMFNDGEYIFAMSGNISLDELIKVAQNVC